MKIIKRIVTVILLIIIFFSLYIASRESFFEAKSSRIIQAPTDLVFQKIDDLNAMAKWSSWLAKDSFPLDRQRTGVGAFLQAKGLYLRTLEEKENEKIVQEISLEGKEKLRVIWEIQPDSMRQYSEVTCVIRGEAGFKQKIINWLYGGAEKIWTPIAEDQMSLLQSYLHKIMNVHKVEPFGMVEYGGGFFVYQTATCSLDALGERLDAVLPPVILYCVRNALPVAGHPFVIYHQYDKEAGKVEFSACMPLSERVQPEGDFTLGFLEKGVYFKTRLKGGYQYSEEAWEKARQFVQDSGKEIDEKRSPFEVYVSGHSKSPNPADWITDIYLPVL